MLYSGRDAMSDDYTPIEDSKASDVTTSDSDHRHAQSTVRP
jgi:hypothetical protein